MNLMPMYMNANYQYNNPHSFKQIQFNIYLTIGQVFTATANLGQTFQSVVDNIFQANNILHLKRHIHGAILEGNKIYFRKTLMENGLYHGCKVLIIIGDVGIKTKYNTGRTQKSLSESTSTNASSYSDDLEGLSKDILYLLYQDYLKKLENGLAILLYRSSERCKNKECTHVHSFLHHHGLVLLFSNRDWICNICHKSFPRNESTYYCSVCDFDVCHNCIGYERKYTLTEFHHEQFKLKSFDTHCHQHPLIYCRTSRSKDKDTTWVCELCFKEYANKIWSFYCTDCDYDVCLTCARKYIPQEYFVQKMGIKIDAHIHNLVYMVTNANWRCQLCKTAFKSFMPTYYCTNCMFNVCGGCMAKLNDENKYPLLFIKGKKESNAITNVVSSCHHHQLMYCITSRCFEGLSAWYCNKCLKDYDNGEWSFYCSWCDYDLCYDCYIKFGGKHY